MKRIFVVFAGLIAFAACATPPAPTVTTNTNVSTANTVVAPTEAEAISKEQAVWVAIERKNYDAFADMLASDALEVTPSAVYDKPGTLAAVKDFEPTEVTFTDWKFLLVDQDAFVITYSVKTKGKYKGKEYPPESARASSAWVNRDGKWVAVYHQECPLSTATPPATTAPKPTPGSPTAPSTEAATGPDPEANEKIVYDLFKNRNYDGFAALLAEDFVDVEPNAVHAKAGALNSASFDTSKAVLSDWKSVKLDADAALVTYLLRIPGWTGMGPLGERHTTIWSRRDGKWLARFHHGTPVVKEPAGAPANASPSATTSPKAEASPRSTP